MGRSLAPIVRQMKAQDKELRQNIAKYSGLPPGMTEEELEQSLNAMEIEVERRLTSDNIMSRWRLTPKQMEIAKCDSTFVVVSGGNRGGKSFYIIWEAGAAALGQHPFMPNYPQMVIWFAGPDYVNHIQPVVQPQFFGHDFSIFPDRLIDHFDETKRTLYLNTGSIIVFKSYDSGREKFQGAPVDLILLDEMPKQDIWTECVARIMTPPNAQKGRIKVAATPFTAPNFYFSVQEKAEAGHPEYGFFNLTVWDNAVSNGGYIPDDKIALIVAEYEDSDEYDTRAMGVAKVLEGAVYKGLPAPTMEEPPIEWPVKTICDPAGGGNTAALFVAYGPMGQRCFFHEYKEKSKDIPMHAAALRRIEADLEAQGYFMAGRKMDPMAWKKWPGNKVEHGGEWNTVAAQYSQAGLMFTPADNDLYGGIERVKSMIVNDQVSIHSRCVKLMKEFQRYYWGPKSPQGKQNPIDKNNDLLDCLRYACLDQSTPKRQAPRKAIFLSPSMDQEARKAKVLQMRQRSRLVV